MGWLGSSLEAWKHNYGTCSYRFFKPHCPKIIKNQDCLNWGRCNWTSTVYVCTGFWAVASHGSGREARHLPLHPSAPTVTGMFLYAEIYKFGSIYVYCSIDIEGNLLHWELRIWKRIKTIKCKTKKFVS